MQNVTPLSNLLQNITPSVKIALINKLINYQGHPELVRLEGLVICAKHPENGLTGLGVQIERGGKQARVSLYENGREKSDFNLV